jgi:hypothetical protein
VRFLAVVLAFNVVVGLGLWFRRPWAVAGFVLGIVFLQVVPYTIFRQHFIQRPEDAGTLTGLVGTVVVLLAVLIVLIVMRK